MKFSRLGRSGLVVSRIGLGCMSFGVPDRGQHPWTLPEEASRTLVRQAVEAGINFFDTANIYSDGTSEEIVGRALRDFARRDEIVVATKVRFANRRGPNLGGLSRKAIFEQIDASLQRRAWTMSTSTRSTAGTRRRRSRRRWRRCTTR